MRERRGRGSGALEKGEGRLCSCNQCCALCCLTFEGLVITDCRPLYLNVSPQLPGTADRRRRAMALPDTQPPPGQAGAVTLPQASAPAQREDATPLSLSPGHSLFLPLDEETTKQKSSPLAPNPEKLKLEAARPLRDGGEGKLPVHEDRVPHLGSILLPQLLVACSSSR